MTASITLGLSVGAFVAGLLVGHLVARRGRRLRFEWRVTLDADEGRVNGQGVEKPLDRD